MKASKFISYTKDTTPGFEMDFSDSHPHELRRVPLKVLCFYIGDIHDPFGPFAHKPTPNVAIRSFLIEYGTSPSFIT